jgi:hypothetical protein
MNKTAPKKHIHKYMRTSLKHVFVWRCATCYHFMPSHLSDLVEGRESICWGCGNIFKLDEYSMRDDFPTCLNCQRTGEDSLIDNNGPKLSLKG